MKLKYGISAILGAASVLLAAPAFAAFDYSVTYTGSSSTATFPSTATITTTDPSTFFTVSPGGSTTGIVSPTTLGLFTLTPASTAPAGAGPFAVTSTTFSTIFSIQGVSNINGTGNIGAPATFTVTGTISGTLGPNSDSTKITNLSGLPTSVTAGGVTYSISLDSIRNPGIVSTQGNNGGVSLDIAAVPEPTLISFLGIGCLSLLGGRRFAGNRK